MEKEEKQSTVLEPAKLHKKLGAILEFIEDLIVLVLTIFIFIISLVAIFDMGISLLKKDTKVYTLIAKFIYVFILIELFRLTIIYLKERRIDTSLMVKTTLIAVLREIIIKAPSFKLPEYIGVSVLTTTLALMYYIPKYIFISESKFELRERFGYKPKTATRRLFPIRRRK
ncbi:MAG: hypothetical protein DSY59_01125 [Persephonella sp.]|nr:MAG: hypothetical protein DSY60_03520 [Persephonella sp.]RUM61866.1 MAG: hypothetical protein DSY59_01125 [Persephonella sp.]